MDRIEQMRIFNRVLEAASFTRAADQLGLPRSTVSEAVTALEKRLQVRLLHRTTRKVTPTQEGRVFYTRCQILLANFEETETLFRTTETDLKGTVRVDVPSRLGRSVIAPALPVFLERFPNIQITLHCTDRRVNLIEENADCVLRVGKLASAGAESALSARSLGELPLLNVASPAYLERFGIPLTPAALESHEAVRYASPTTGRVEPWEWQEGGRLHSLNMQGRVTVDHAESLLACCLAGLGLAQIPAYDVRGALELGQLCEVLPDWRAEPLPLALLYPHRTLRPKRVKVFSEWLGQLLEREVLEPQRPEELL